MDAEEVPHVLGAQHLLLGDQSLEELLAVAGPYVLGPHLGVLQPQDRLGEGADGGRRRLLDEEVALLAALEGVEDEVHRVVEGHHEARHVGIGDGDGLPFLDLLQEQRDHRAAGGHDVAVARQAEHRVAREQLPASGHHVLLHEGLRHPHRVDGVGGLVGREEDGFLDAVPHAGGDDVVAPLDVGLDRLHGEELAAGDLLQSGRGEDVVYPDEGALDRAVVPDVADVELKLLGVVLLPHVVLLLLVAREDADLLDGGVDQAVDDRVAEASGASGDEEGLAV